MSAGIALPHDAWHPWQIGFDQIHRPVAGLVLIAASLQKRLARFPTLLNHRLEFALRRDRPTSRRLAPYDARRRDILYCRSSAQDPEDHGDGLEQTCQAFEELMREGVDSSGEPERSAQYRSKQETDPPSLPTDDK